MSVVEAIDLSVDLRRACSELNPIPITGARKPNYQFRGFGREHVPVSLGFLLIRPGVILSQTHSSVCKAHAESLGAIIGVEALAAALTLPFDLVERVGLCGLRRASFFELGETLLFAERLRSGL